jgi:hypothetical protein
MLKPIAAAHPTQNGSRMSTEFFGELFDGEKIGEKVAH